MHKVSTQATPRKTQSHHTSNAVHQRRRSHHPAPLPARSWPATLHSTSLPRAQVIYISWLMQTSSLIYRFLPTACGAGTTISCTLSSGQSCKGNFSPKQASVVVTQAHGNCHVSLYPDNDQQGGVIQRLDTDTTGTCVFTSVCGVSKLRDLLQLDESVVGERIGQPF